MIEYWYKFKHRYFPFVVAHLGKLVLNLLALTCRFEIKGQEEFIKAANAGSFILSIWHNRLPMVTCILKRIAPQFTYAAFVSDSRDGELIATIVNSYKQVHSIRVPKRSRAYSLKLMIEEIRRNKDILVITPDGPRGPKYQAKPGIAHAAVETGAPIISLNWESKRCWRLNTWDQMMIPKPFTTINVSISPPISLAEEDPSTALEVLNRKLSHISN